MSRLLTWSPYASQKLATLEFLIKHLTDSILDILSVMKRFSVKSLGLSYLVLIKKYFELKKFFLSPQFDYPEVVCTGRTGETTYISYYL